MNSFQDWTHPATTMNIPSGKNPGVQSNYSPELYSTPTFPGYNYNTNNQYPNYMSDAYLPGSVQVSGSLGSYEGARKIEKKTKKRKSKLDDPNLTPEEREELKEKKKRKNTEAVRKYRMNRKRKMEMHEVQLKLVQEDNIALKQKYKRLLKETAFLKEALVQAQQGLAFPETPNRDQFSTTFLDQAVAQVPQVQRSSIENSTVFDNTPLNS